MTTLTETDVEQAALAWLSGVGWQAPPILKSSVSGDPVAV